MGWVQRFGESRRGLLAALVGLAMLAAGCSGDGSAGGPATADATSTAAGAATSRGGTTTGATTGPVGGAAGAPAGTGTTAGTTGGPAKPGSGARPVTNGPRDRRAVALTFDSNMTDAMLRELDSGKVASFDNTAVIDELDRYQVPATLFLAGKWMERYPDTTRRLAADPLFELGSHSYAHLGYTANCYRLGSLAVADMATDVTRGEQVLHSFAPNATDLFRFPGGCYDQTALDAIAPTGVKIIQYDLASGDAFGTNVSAIVRNVLNHARNGSIIVMHITGGNTAPLTDQALPPIVQGLRARGYQLVTVSQLLAAPGSTAP